MQTTAGPEPSRQIYVPALDPGTSRRFPLAFHVSASAESLRVVVAMMMMTNVYLLAKASKLHQ
jgi:hypothetical protein